MSFTIPNNDKNNSDNMDCKRTDYWVPDEDCDDHLVHEKWVESGHNIGNEELEAHIVNNIAESHKVIDFNNMFGTHFNKSEFQFVIQVSKTYKILISDIFDYLQVCHFCGKNFDCVTENKLYCSRACQSCFEEQDMDCFRCLGNKKCLYCKNHIVPNNSDKNGANILKNSEYDEEYLEVDNQEEHQIQVGFS